jgi:antitoxin (DNA-binding transcriptional repressor) of toxin-antitoxin stability system
VRELSASEVARSFSALLDGAENGEAVVITRGGRRVAMLVPAPRANGAALLEVLRRWEARVPVGDAFEADVAAARESSADLDGDPWRE